MNEVSGPPKTRTGKWESHFAKASVVVGCFQQVLVSFGREAETLIRTTCLVAKRNSRWQAMTKTLSKSSYYHRRKHVIVRSIKGSPLSQAVNECHRDPYITVLYNHAVQRFSLVTNKGLSRLKEAKDLSAMLQGYSVHRAVTLLALRIDTGRRHQIRIHLAAIGCPTFNDALYLGRVSSGFLSKETRKVVLFFFSDLLPQKLELTQCLDTYKIAVYIHPETHSKPII